MGLLARAIEKPDAAERHWRAVLAVHPHHLATASRLAALMLSQKRSADALLEQAVMVSAETMQQQYQLALCSQSGASFDQAVGDLERGKQPSCDARANVAFALGLLGLLDHEHGQWKNLVMQDA